MTPKRYEWLLAKKAAHRKKRQEARKRTKRPQTPAERKKALAAKASGSLLAWENAVAPTPITA